MKRNRFLFSLLLLFSFMMTEKGNVKIFIAGDSTASIKEIKAYPETGWGMPFAWFWDSTVTVVNKAKNGRSTSSFRKEGLWQQIMEEASAGDYVIIQFGHNDEVPTKKTFTTEAEFKNNLQQYVKEVRAKNATPLLLTPMARRKFDSTGKISGTHDIYAQIIRNVAKEEKVILLDMDTLTQGLYQQFGEANSGLLFLQLKPGEHPNYPAGKEDNTHFNELGARLVAQLVLNEIKDKCPDLATHIIKPAVKK